MGGDESHEGAGGRVEQPDGGAVPQEHTGGEPPAGGGLPRLMARLGRLLERLGPENVVVMSQEEYERAKLATYAAGWQDAAEEYRPRIAAARWEGWLGRWRPLRVMEGPGEVIAFPAGRGGPAGTGEPAAEEEQHGPAVGDGPRGTAPAEGTQRRTGVRTGSGSGSGTPVPRPRLSPKNRRSKSPTIPRLPPSERRRPRIAGDATDDAGE
ncbi:MULTISPECIES: hypothetical protein [unclassified Streptomyces]|uniref:hypothetical protein n=1 Tax=unclassified Streptomyces TaxID=2593676 RepID=UPI002E2E24AA|nr:hypothetical protein [Streptomyces sp. NBC_00223]